MASPVPLESPKEEKEVLEPAVEGTLSVMRAALRHKIKRVALTSSEIAIIM